jgi:hypothetical protein
LQPLHELFDIDVSAVGGRGDIAKSLAEVRERLAQHLPAGAIEQSFTASGIRLHRGGFDIDIVPPFFPREEGTSPRRDVLPFLAAVRDLLGTERIWAAREMLSAAPAYVLSDPLIAPIRAILAPPTITRTAERDGDRSQEYEWFREQGHRYRGHWVAVDRDRLVASARTLRELRQALRNLAPTRPPLLRRID